MGYDAGKQAKQPHGQSSGVPKETSAKHVKETWGNKPGKGGSGQTKEFGNIERTKRGSELLHKEGAAGHETADGLHSIGFGNKTGKAEHHPHMGSAHTFKPPAMQNAHGYGHSGGERKGALRMSGVKGAHRIGCK
jgi:hypothetical protein